MTSAPNPPTDAELAHAAASLNRLVATLQTVLFGQETLIELVVSGVLARGHLLLEGLPGLGKTELVKGLAHALGLTARRVQFTPDLLPGDITGNPVLEETATGRRFVFQRGPVFANILLADEINRASPKTQSALLEAMQERRVTAGGETHTLPDPFFVLATQNPIDLEGTYPLPEAQLDRFMFNVMMDYLPEADEVKVVQQTTAGRPAPIDALFTGEDVLRFHDLVRKVPVAEEMVRYAVQLASTSRPHQPNTPDFVNEWVSWGAGTRAGQFLILGAKARALLRGRAHVTVEDIQALAVPVLRHRVLLNYRAEAEGIKVDEVIKRLLAAAKLPVAGK